ncbi:uncharacterized LabA/DUF88 family protein [Pedobacter sp. UYEF25]
MKKIALLILTMASIVAGCNSNKEADNYLGIWAASDPNDSISAPVTIYKEGENYFAKVTNKNIASDIPLVYNEKQKYMTMGQEIRLYYYYNKLKMNFRGKTEQLEKITESEANLRTEKMAIKLKADSIKKANPFKDYKNSDADIARDILKNRKF